ncbi:hypothetical protein IVB69_05780 [Flavobacterium sp. J49]|uniref:hypothetical protein n=1 Tax=Flavobacterium sp. J49 TaxID=2718534 RepID=UPI00159445A1|nr:hypothetical protein [Flavobacterium sp. J49]MBF6640982.1 hypothetical protein [Flavobacterium sp. J49]NIC02229.1 hypothetical protein [Flavobacterium sp. J49]
MKSVFALLFLLVFSFKGFSQFETPKKTLKIAPVTNSSGQVAPTSSKSFTYPSIFDKKDKLLESVSLLKKKPEEEKSIMEKEKFADASKQYTDKMNKKSSDGEILEKFKSDSFLGQFKTGTKIISIACRDHEAPDGDLVRIWLNDRIAVDAILLEVSFKEVYLDLNEGINKIEIEALNQGESGPNTAQFVIYDQKKGMITTNKWNLTTGVKAKLVILKDDGTLEEQK